MTHLPFIQQSCGDVLAETTHLSTEEFGAYQLLVFAFWQHGALPGDDTRLARIVRATPDRWAEMRDTLSELFGVDWTPERLAKRRDDVETAHLKKSAGGRKGARKRWDGDNPPDGIPNRIPNGIPNGSPNGSANGNHNHNYNTPALEEKNSPIRTHTREDIIPAPRSEADGLAILQAKRVFPPDYEVLLPKLMRGELTRAELDAAA